MEIKHVPGYSPMSLLGFKNFNVCGQAKFRKKQYDAWISGVCSPKFTKPGTRVEQPSVLNKFFFQNYNILQRSGVRAESLRAGSENMPNFVTFWPTL